MRNVILYIGMSLDGYIADKEGSVSWMGGQNPDDDTAGSYPDFIKGIDTVIMGYCTYHQIMTELSPDKWVYDGLQSYVITHRTLTGTDNIFFTGENICGLTHRLKNMPGRDIWICGGADIAGQFMRENLIDVYHVSVLPVILGSGIRLFDNMEREIKLKLIKTWSYNGITDLVYKRRSAGFIRKYRPEDEAEIMDIWLTSNEEAHSFISPDYWKACSDAVIKELPLSEVYVFEEHGRIQGFIGLQRNYIAGIFIRSCCRSRGIGKLLLDCVKQLKDVLTLHVYEKNERAARFYYREGFMTAGRCTDEAAGEPEFMMLWERGN